MGMWKTEHAWNHLVRKGLLKWEGCSLPHPLAFDTKDLLCLWAYNITTPVMPLVAPHERAVL